MCGETAIVVSKCRQGLENAILIHRIPFILFGNCYGTAVENATQTPRQRVQYSPDCEGNIGTICVENKITRKI